MIPDDVECTESASLPHADKRMPKSACAFAQTDLGIRCPLTDTMDTVHVVYMYIREQRIPM